MSRHRDIDAGNRDVPSPPGSAVDSDSGPGGRWSSKSDSKPPLRPNASHVLVVLSARRSPAWGAPAGWHRRGTCRGPWPPGLGLAAGAALPLAGSVPVSPGRADSVGLGRRNLTHTQLNSGRAAAAACKVDTVLVITSNRPTAPPAQRYGGIITTDSEAASATDSDSESHWQSVAVTVVATTEYYCSEYAAGLRVGDPTPVPGRGSGRGSGRSLSCGRNVTRRRSESGTPRRPPTATPGPGPSHLCRPVCPAEP